MEDSRWRVFMGSLWALVSGFFILRRVREVVLFFFRWGFFGGGGVVGGVLGSSTFFGFGAFGVLVISRVF